MLTLAAAAMWLPGLFLLRFAAHALSGRNGSGPSALIGFIIALLLCLLLLRLVWWLPYRSAGSWMWASVFALCLCGLPVWVGTALANSETVELGNDLLGSAWIGLATGAPLAALLGAGSGFLVGSAARAGRAQAGPSERPLALVSSSISLLLMGAATVAYFVVHDVWPGPS